MPNPHKLKHIVMFSARDKKDIAKIKKGLEMLAGIPEALNLSVSENLGLDTISEGMDVVLYAEFVSENALKTFKQHTLYEECIQVVRPLRDKRIAVDFY